MSNETEKPTKGWTIETYAVHNEAIRIADEKFQNERDRWGVPLVLISPGLFLSLF